MIENLVNPMRLPSVLLKESQKLPKIACVYFAINSAEEIQYIGSSTNLKNRWLSHNKLEKIDTKDEIRIFWLPIAESDVGYLKIIESQFIAKYCPPLNRQNPKKVEFANLIQRQGLTQQKFAETVENSWRFISGRPLSRQAVNAWCNGRETPRLSPAEMLALIEVLGCTLTELAIAFSCNDQNYNPK